MIQKEIYAFGSTQINVGLSAIIKIAPSANQAFCQFKYLSGGSLEIVPIPIALSGTSCAPWGTGYLMATTEVFSMNAYWPGNAVAYLAAKNATCVVQAVFAYTSGISLTV